MKSKTLLEKAKMVKIKRACRRSASDEELTLMLAMIQGEITVLQAYHALGKRNRNMAQEFYSIVRSGVLDGRITIKQKSK